MTGTIDYINQSKDIGFICTDQTAELLYFSPSTVECPPGIEFKKGNIVAFEPQQINHYNKVFDLKIISSKNRYS